MVIAARLRRWAKALKADAVTLWFAARHPGTPWYTKALAVLVVAYALSPIDLIPDFIPVLGYLDDVILLPVLIWLTVRLLPPAVLDASRIRADEWMRTEGKKPRSRWGLVLVVSAWIAIAWLAWTLWTQRL